MWDRDRRGKESHIPELDRALPVVGQDATRLRHAWDGVLARVVAVECLYISDVAQEVFSVYVWVVSWWGDG